MMNSSHTGQAHQLLPAVYALLGDVIRVVEVAQEYRDLLADVLQAASLSKPQGASVTILPVLACVAAGGSLEQAIPVAAAWRSLHIAAKVLDDVEDGALGNDSPKLAARSINLSTGLFAVAHLALARLVPDVLAVVQPRFHHTVLQMAGGQHEELSERGVTDVDAYLQIMAAKSGAFFALATSAGACCARADESQALPYAQFGHAIGMLIQVGDDLDGLRRSGRQGDLALGQRGLPIHYARTVASPSERARLEDLLERALRSTEAEAQARDLLAALGAEAYLLAELARFRHRAQAALDGIDQHGSSLPLRGWLAQFTGGADP